MNTPFSALAITLGSWSLALPDGTLELVRPWLLLLAPLPLLLTRYAPPFFSRFEAVHVPFFALVAQAAGAQPAPGAVVLRRGWGERALGLVVWLLLLLALAQPQWVEPPITRIEAGRDLLLAVDISQSMAERDFAGRDGRTMERLTAVKQVLAEFIAKRQGDRLGLVVIGDGAWLHVPFTRDAALLTRMLDELQVGMAGARTRIGDAIGLASKVFEASHAPRKAMIVLSDGNDTGSRIPPEVAARIVHERGVTLHAVAIGNPATRGNEKLELATLQAIARIGGGRFALGTDQQKLAAIYGELDALETQQFTTQTWRARQPLFHWPLGVAVALLLLGQALAALFAIALPRKEGAV